MSKNRIFNEVEFFKNLKEDLKRRGIENDEYFNEKSKKLAEMFKQLEDKGCFIELNSREDVKRVDEENKRYIELFENVRALYVFFQKTLELPNIYEPYEFTDVAASLKDKFDREYSLSAKSMILTTLILYMSFCELMRHLVLEIINYKELGLTRKPEIGVLIGKLNEKKITNPFEDIDTELRNSIAHMDFKVDNKSTNIIIYKNKKEIKKIDFGEVFELIKKSDKITYLIMHAIILCMKNYEIDLITKNKQEEIVSRYNKKYI